MNNDVKDSYQVLGVDQFASMNEVKAAYRDLAKVWHPDRFSHDQRLQEKAQDKLKEINDAFEQIKSGKARGRRFQAAENNATVRTPSTGRRMWLLPSLCCAAVFLGALVLLARPQFKSGSQPVPTSESGEKVREDSPAPISVPEKTVSNERSPRNEINRAKDQTVNAAEAVNSIPGPPVQPLPTVSVTIDPSTGLLATAECPSKVRMTYADRSEPQQFCTAHPPAAAGKSGMTDSKPGLKSFAKRVVSPKKWFGKSNDNQSTEGQ